MPSAEETAARGFQAVFWRAVELVKASGESFEDDSHGYSQYLALGPQRDLCMEANEDIERM